MITINNCKQKGEYDFSGTSKEGKPTNCGVNSLFFELDTGNFYYYTGVRWEKIPMKGGNDNLNLVKQRISGTIKEVKLEHLEGIQKIGEYAFFGCWCLLRVTIPRGVEEIGDYAFGECTALESIRMMSSTPPICGTKILEGSNGRIYVPQGSREAYRAASGWSEYSSIIIES